MTSPHSCENALTTWSGRVSSMPSKTSIKTDFFYLIISQKHLLWYYFFCLIIQKPRLVSVFIWQVLQITVDFRMLIISIKFLLNMLVWLQKNIKIKLKEKVMMFKGEKKKDCWKIMKTILSGGKIRNNLKKVLIVQQ